MPAREQTEKEIVVDAHGHVGWYGYDAARLVANMDEHGIDVTWLLTWEAPVEEIDLHAYSGIFWPGRMGMPMEDVIAAVQQYPDRFVPFWAPDPRQRHALDRLRGAVKNMGVRGCGEMKCRIMMDDPHALEMWHYCGENNLPVIFHMDVPLPRGEIGTDPGYWYCCDWENLAKALELCPKTIFLAHGPGFWREISGGANNAAGVYPTGPVKPNGKLMRYMRKYPNLYCDLSASSAVRALGRDLSVARRFFTKYQRRCLFARDGFDNELARLLHRCKLSQPALTRIMGLNALQLVPI